MSAVLDDDVGFDEPAAEEQQLTPATGDKNAVAINSDMKRVQAALAELDRIEASVPDIEARFPKDAIYACETTKGMKDAVEHRAAYRDPRISSEKARKMAKAPLLTLGRRVDARAGALSERLTEGESLVDQQIKAEEARKEKERQDRINAEAGRVLKIQEALAEIAQDVQIATGKASADILVLLERMRGTQPEPLVFQEMVDAARAAWAAGITKLETAHKAKLWDEEQEAERVRVEAERKARQEAEDAERARVSAAQAEEAARLKRLADEQARAQAAQQQAMAITQRVFALMGKPAADIREALNLLMLTRYPDDAYTVVLTAHDQAVALLQTMLSVAETQEAQAAQLKALQDAEETQERAAAAAQDTPQGVQPGFEPGREGMAPEACESAAGRGTDGAPALVTHPHHESPDVGPTGAGQPADAGPAGGSIETSEAEARDPSPAEVRSVLQLAGGVTLTGSLVDPRTLLLRDLLPFFDFLRQPYVKFPSNPKFSAAWGAELPQRAEELEARVLAALGLPGCAA